MSITYVSAELRRLVVARAAGLCEYCLIAEEDTFYGCEVDHIILRSPFDGKPPPQAHIPSADEPEA